MWKHWVNQKILRNKWKQTDVNEKSSLQNNKLIT